MNKIMINLEDENINWMIDKYFEGKYFVSIEELLDVISKLDDEVEELNYEIEELKNKINEVEEEPDNYEDYKLREMGLI
jgi:predicted RNase H-like nuclease (RuvC/YqgF family)